MPSESAATMPSPSPLGTPPIADYALLAIPLTIRPLKRQEIELWNNM